MIPLPRPFQRAERRPRPRVLLGVVALVVLVWAGSAAARPASPRPTPGRPTPPRPWVGPVATGAWMPTDLTLQTNALLADATHPAALFAATDDGVWRSGDGGRRWQRAGSGLRGATIMTLAAAPGGGALFAGAADGTVSLKRTHGDGAWRRVSPSLGVNPIYSLTVSPDGRETLLAGTVGGLYRGTRTGSGWRWQQVARTGDAAVTSIVWAPSKPRTGIGFASVFGVSPPVLMTRDGGWTWRAAVAGLPSVLPTQTLLALSAPHPRLILTTMGGGVWEQEATSPWRDISAGLPERHAMALVALPRSGRPVLYGGTMGDGVYVKQGDAAWQRLGHGLTGVDNTILALAATAGSPHALLAGTVSGVFRYVATRGSVSADEQR